MSNREKMVELIALGKLTQKQAAHLIAEYTRRPCALRTVQAWLNDPEKNSARTCPDWAVEALEASLKLQHPPIRSGTDRPSAGAHARG